MSITPSVRYPYVYGNHDIDDHYEHNDLITNFADSTERKIDVYMKKKVITQ